MKRTTPWADKSPVRQELFGLDRLEQHARSLAVAQTVSLKPPKVQSLAARLDANATRLLEAYRASGKELESGRGVVPAAEWLLDNYHLVEEQIREIRDNLPPGFYRQLPKLESGPFAGYPRVFGIAWAYVAHTDSHFDAEVLLRFIAAYQSVEPLTIGELWALAITLRIVLVENLRRLADLIAGDLRERADAEAFSTRLLEAGTDKAALQADIATRNIGDLSAVFASTLAKRLRDRDPDTTPAFAWLQQRLAAQSLTIDDVVRLAHQEQAVSNVTVRNVITSMRQISDIGWPVLFESMSLVDHTLRSASNFELMDFPTRNLYRSAVEQLSRRSKHSELQIAEQALEAARTARAAAVDPVEAERVGDPGYHLIADGRDALEQSIGFRPTLRTRLGRFTIRHGLLGYVGWIFVLTVVMLVLALRLLSVGQFSIEWVVVFSLALSLPLSEASTGIVNRAVSWFVGAKALHGLDLHEGIPASMRAMVVVPSLLTNEAELLEQVEQLEVHFLSSAGGEIYYALLTDWADADAESLADDAALLDHARQAIGKLNDRHGPGPSGRRFWLLHRRRVFSQGEGKWMGWERKRGKLEELNRLLRGARDTTYLPLDDDSALPEAIRYVITLDADTRLPRETASRLIGKMAHPLNSPRFDAHRQCVVDGYAILQPRVTPALPVGHRGSIYQRVFAGPSGIDPYASASSNVYQDMFGEGSFVGKGIYDVDAFEAVMAGRVPAGKLLSHDLLEGIFARAGLASDVEVVEEFPTRYDVDAKRQHRWIRGDWQLLPWIFGLAPGGHDMSGVGRWKMYDNIRRSLIAPAAVLALALCWLLPAPSGLIGAAIVLVALAIPAFVPSFSRSRPERVSLRSHVRSSIEDFRIATLQTILMSAWLPDRAWRSIDAIGRTLWRMGISRRHLLQWTSSAQSARARRPGLLGSYRQMIGSTLLTLALAAAALAWAPAGWPLVLAFVVTWLAAPGLAGLVSEPLPARRQAPLSSDEASALRLIARRTWRYFETFVTARENFLPPDNFQEDPKGVVAHRTSPTNLGLYLLSAVTARDFGWSGTATTVKRIESTLSSMLQLARYKGHFYNWYATEDRRALDPPYVSSVDSGNLAGHLLVVAVACESWIGQVAAPKAWAGMFDALALARQALLATPDVDSRRVERLMHVLDQIHTLLERQPPCAFVAATLDDLVESAQLSLDGDGDRNDEGAEMSTGSWSDLAYWIDAIRNAAAEHAEDQRLALAGTADLDERLAGIARSARGIAMSMDFSWLLAPDRKLLSIGYSLTDNRLDPSCYDLLASEARLASLFAIAKCDIPTEHWFRLGRSATPIEDGSALISWSGSMFEYLMPSLFMRAPHGSLLEQTNRLVVQRQESYGRSLGIPWGVSESAYNARDLEFTYQYSNFGVPGLGLKRGLSNDVVIAPYATGLATMIDPHAALRNYQALARLGGAGRFGFYDALDFTKSRLPEGQDVAVVRNYMAHHQGMSIVAIANALNDGLMRTRFHTEPIIVASELLLQERMPRDVNDLPIRVAEVKPAESVASADMTAVRIVETQGPGAPVTHLLSNGRYAVMLTAAGSGYSRWGDLAVTRWREDPTRDNEGSFIFLRDTDNQRVWSATAQPLGVDDAKTEAVFGEDHAVFHRRDGRLLTSTEVVVSGEDDAEVRRVTLTNSSRRSHEIEVTTYSELVLTTPATDNAHPAFAKMFVQTERLTAFDALIATRRKRTGSEAEVWAAHFAVIEGEQTAKPQYETDRLRFIGRGRDLSSAVSMADGRALSNTVGTVLDPVFSLRHRVKVPPGGRVRLSFWTVIASSRAELMDLIDRHDDRSAFDRAKTFAWTHAQVQLRHLGINAEEAGDFQRLAAAVVFNDARFRAPSATILRGMGPQSALWAHSISGDLPVVVLRIDDIDDIAQVRQLLRAHEYWRTKRLGVDLVIINERASSYVQDLQIAIETAVRSSQSRPTVAGEVARGSVYVLRADLITPEALTLLHSVARVLTSARRGTVASQLAAMPRTAAAAVPLATKPFTAAPVDPILVAPDATIAQTLEFFNGTGGFADEGREYVTILQGGRTTPAPWINVVSNPRFGFQVSADGSGFTWAENSRDNQLTTWSNDSVCDPIGEVIYVSDLTSAEIWTATAQPIRDGGTYVARHGRGFSRFEHAANGIELSLLQFVPLDDPIKISRLTLHNTSAKPRRLALTMYCEWVLGTSRNAPSPFIATQRDADTGALLVRNPWGTTFPNRVSFVDLAGRQTTWTGDRAEFLGRDGQRSAPLALVSRTPLSGRTGAGVDPCTALQLTIDLAPGASYELAAFIGQCASDVDARALVMRYRDADLDAVLAKVTNHWSTLLGSVQVKTPDRSMDILLNGWLLYQTLACRVWARSAFYQASGAYGFRDQLQDGMALTLTMPEQTRHHLLRSAGRQFVEGDVQHWWLPHSGQGVRTQISDDRVWLAYAAATYIGTTGDSAVLDEQLPWIEGPPLKPGEHDAFFNPSVSHDTASLFDHCARGLDQCIELTGQHGLPLMGTGDWNDGMNRVGQDGRGESVWLAWLLIRTIELFAPFAQTRDPARADRWRAHASSVRAAVEFNAWDGEWYRRATFDDGTWLGSKDSEECQIDSIAQSWAVLSGAGDPSRAATAMRSVDRLLVELEQQLALLFTPPFDHTHHDPGYIKGYPPGLRENGGQYSHAAMWAVMAFARLGESSKAVDLFALLNPVNHALTRSAVNRYKVEPYVVAADVYSVAPHSGRGGWTWYTGSAGWMYRAGLEGILGIVREADTIVIRPRIPANWPGFEVKLRLGDSQIDIVVTRSDVASMTASIDGQSVGFSGDSLRLALRPGAHSVAIALPLGDGS
ncbi:glucoamylase family protein [soil metagenome]